MLDFDAGDGSAGGICNYFSYLCFGEESYVGEMHDLTDAVDVGVGLGVD